MKCKFYLLLSVVDDVVVFREFRESYRFWYFISWGNVFSNLSGQGRQRSVFWEIIAYEKYNFH